MSILKNIGSSLKKTGIKVINEIKKQQESYEKQKKKKQGYLNLKKEILKNSTLTEMKKICLDYGLNEPSLYTTDPISGNKIKKKETPRNIYFKYLQNNIPLDQLIDYAKKKKMNIFKVLQEKRKIDEEFNKESKFDFKNAENEFSETEDEFTQIEVTKKKINQLDLILEKVDEEFLFENIRDEKELERLLVQFLKLIFKEKYVVESQYKVDGGIIDLAIDDKYGIELKIAENNKILENLEGQVLKYCRFFGKNKVGIIILKTSKIDDNKLDSYIEYYKEHGAKVLVLDRGTIRRRKSKVKTYRLVSN